MLTATAPMPSNSVQDASRAILKESGPNTWASVHTLRHSYTTQLLKAGVNLLLIQEDMGHHAPTITAISTSLTLTAMPWHAWRSISLWSIQASPALTRGS